MDKLIRFLKEEDGLTTVEYAIAGSLVGLTVITAFTALGDQVCVVINGIITAIGGTAATC